MSLYATVGKRAFDLAVALPLLAVTAPVQIGVAALVRLKLGSPVLFRQERAGQYARPFTLLKFRTMLNANPSGGLTTDADRMTPLGTLLRSTSLDELPSLINVLRGDMSLVGPRPLYMSYVPLYSTKQRTRLNVPPGITGLAQISGRNAVSWDNRLALDADYVQSLCFRNDLKILLGTLRTVLSREGISEDGQATMSAFKGTSAS